MKKLLFLLCLLAFAQTPAVTFQTWPNIMQASIGASKCGAWSHLAEPWPLIVYCVGPSVCGASGTQPCTVMMPAESGQKIEGQWDSPDAYFSWIIQPSKTAPAPALDWDFAVTPIGGMSKEQTGTF
jgi:hypothetical protein